MTIKHWLYFSLGAIATLPFGMRTLIQWFLSEKKRYSHVTLAFWYLSTLGNILLLTHYLIQMQFHLYCIRFFPAYFSFRQVSLMKKTASPFSWSKLIKISAFLVISLTALFMLRSYLEYGHFVWILNPQMPWDNVPRNVSGLWHALGFFGASLFISRMWVQWWQSEKAQKSVLTPTFWWISIIGGVLTLIYALYIKDYMTAIGYLAGLIPYIRNLMLIKKESVPASISKESATKSIA